MTTRGEKRTSPESRVFPPGMRVESPGAGSDANAHWRDLTSLIGGLSGDVTEDSLLGAVEELRDIVGGPLGRYVLEIGRFIDEGGKYSGGLADQYYPSSSVSMFLDKNQRSEDVQFCGGIDSLVTADTISSGTPIVLGAKGPGKLFIVANAGTDTEGFITATGTSVNRNTGVETGSDTDVIKISGLTTDSGSTDADGNDIHGFSNASITSKWFTGAVTLSTTDVNLSDVDVWHVSFEQLNDQQFLELQTLDANLLTTNANAEFHAHLYTIKVKDGTCTITNVASLEIDGGDGLANKFWRLRRGNLGLSLDGRSDGFWVDVYMGPIASTYISDLGLKVWYKGSEMTR